jgi:large subunit ribosomal protein L24
MPDIRKGDTVQIIAGKEKGKTGKVLEVLRDQGRVRIERHLMVKRHLKKGRSQSNPAGGIVEKDGTVAAIAAVMVMQGDEKVRREGIKRELGAKEKARQEKRKAAAR